MEYAQFSLVDPTKLATEGIKGATVMTIIARLQGNEVLELTQYHARQQSQIINHNVAELVHTKRDRKRIESTRQIWLFYYCSRCGGRLMPAACAGCKRPCRIQPPFSPKQPILPPKVRDYAIQHGHRSEDR